MKTFLRRSLGALALGGLLLPACHHADPNPGGCQLSYATSSTYFTYIYDAAGRLTAARTPSAVGELRYDYTYAGTQVKLPVTFGNNDSWVYWVLTLNAQGYLATATSYFNPGGGQVRERAIFGYDASGHLTGYHSDGYRLGAPTTPTESLRMRLDYQNGDLTQLFDSLDNSLTVATYGPQANHLPLPLLVENISLLHLDPGLLPLLGKPTAHLTSTLRNVQPVNPYPYSITFTYSLDGSGRVTAFSTNNGLSAFYTFSNTCP